MKTWPIAQERGFSEDLYGAKFVDFFSDSAEFYCILHFGLRTQQEENSKTMEILSTRRGVKI